MKADTCSKNSAALFNKERQDKKFLRLFDGIGFDDIVIIVGSSRKGEWEVEIRLPSGCIRRRRPKQKKN